MTARYDSEPGRTSPSISEGQVQQSIPVVRRSLFPVYLVVGLFYTSVAVNVVMVVESVTYNKICYNHFTNISLCTNSTFSKTHPALQQGAASWSNYVSAIQILPALLTNLALSSYCDNVGHRLPIALPTVGVVLASAWLSVLATPRYITLPIELLLVYGFLISLFGGTQLFIMSCYSYLTLVTSEKRMATAMAMLEGSIEIGCLVGVLASGPLVDNFGLDTLTYGNLILSVLPVIVIILLLKEVPRERVVGNKTWKETIGISHMLNAVHCVFKQRRGYNRLLIHLCYVVNFSAYIAISGYTANCFLYFNKEIGFSLTELSIFYSCLMAVKGIGGPVILFLNKRITNLDEFSLGILSCAILSIGYIIMSSYIPFGIWIGGALQGFQTVVPGVIRAFQIKLVKENETGKLFAYDGILKVVSALVTVIMFKEFYSLTVTSFPALFLAVCAFLYLLSMIVMIIIGKIHSLPVCAERRSLLQASTEISQ